MAENTVTVEYCNSLSKVDDKNCIPNADKSQCESPKECGQDTKGDANIVTVEYCNSLLKVDNQNCIPNVDKSQCESQVECGQDAEMAANTVTPNYCNSLKISYVFPMKTLLNVYPNTFVMEQFLLKIINVNLFQLQPIIKNVLKNKI